MEPFTYEVISQEVIIDLLPKEKLLAELYSEWSTMSERELSRFYHHFHGNVTLERAINYEVFIDAFQLWDFIQDPNQEDDDLIGIITPEMKELVFKTAQNMLQDVRDIKASTEEGTMENVKSPPRRRNWCEIL